MLFTIVFMVILYLVIGALVAATLIMAWFDHNPGKKMKVAPTLIITMLGWPYAIILLVKYYVIDRKKKKGEL